MLVETSRKSALAVRFSTPAAHGHRHGFFTPHGRPDSLGKLVAIQVDHADVKEQGVRLKPFGELECTSAAICGLHQMSG